MVEDLLDIDNGILKYTPSPNSAAREVCFKLVTSLASPQTKMLSRIPPPRFPPDPFLSRFQVILDDKDEIWVRNRHKHIAEAIVDINKEFSDFSSTNKAAIGHGKDVGLGFSIEEEYCDMMQQLVWDFFLLLFQIVALLMGVINWRDSVVFVPTCTFCDPPPPL